MKIKIFKATGRDSAHLGSKKRVQTFAGARYTRGFVGRGEFDQAVVFVVGESGRIGEPYEYQRTIACRC